MTGPGRRGSIRFRITVLATTLVAVVLAVAGVAIVLIHRQQLYSNLDSSLEQRADLIVAEITADAPGEIAFANSNTEDRLAQLVDADGIVVDATANLEGEPPVAPAPDGRQAIETVSGLPIEDDYYRLLSRRVPTADDDLILHVGQNADDVRDAVRLLATSLGIAVAVLVGIFCALVWWLVGRTLRPVEEIRSEVAEIGATGLDRRVSRPSSDDEIARLADTMNGMLDRVEASTRRQQEFVADASHELRTPLTRIRTELEVDLADSDRADLLASHRSVLDEVSKMNLLIEDLLHLARSDAGAVAHRMEPVDLDDIVVREVRHLRVEQGMGIDMTDVGAAAVEGDPEQLRRAVRNLIHNACRHASGRVSVALTEDDETVELTVDDDGPGIPESQREQVFERFTRLDSSRASTGGGTGLGLAITRDIVERHGGTVTIDDGPRGGARFVVRLPAKPEGPRQASSRS